MFWTFVHPTFVSPSNHKSNTQKSVISSSIMNLTKIISLFFALLFTYFVVVQYNDPDPEIWMPIYGIAVAACLSIFFAKAPRSYVFVIMTLAYFFAAYQQWPPQYEGVFWGEMQMRSINIELARESLGLVISGMGMLVMAFLRNKLVVET